VEELSILIAEAQRAVLDAQLEYRPLGTVSLTGSGSITVQRLVMISISDGMLAEVRRSTGNGTEVVARGTVGEVESQRFVVTITELSGSRAPAVGDQVFVAVPR